MVCSRFSYYLSMRGFFGQVVFDHHNEKLELKVQTDDLVGKQGREKDAKVCSVFHATEL